VARRKSIDNNHLHVRKWILDYFQEEDGEGDDCQLVFIRSLSRALREHAQSIRETAKPLFINGNG